MTSKKKPSQTYSSGPPIGIPPTPEGVEIEAALKAVDDGYERILPVVMVMTPRDAVVLHQFLLGGPTITRGNSVSARVEQVAKAHGLKPERIKLILDRIGRRAIVLFRRAVVDAAFANAEKPRRRRPAKKSKKAPASRSRKKSKV
jgi:hypothetical protein